MFFISFFQAGYGPVKRALASWAKPDSSLYSFVEERDYQRSSLDIEINFEYLRTGQDVYQCSAVDQVIIWNGYNYTCTEKDIITSNKMDAIQETSINLKNYFSKIVRVRKTESIKFSDVKGTLYDDLFPKSGNMTSSNYILLISRPFNSTQKITSQNLYYNKHGRPIISVINIKAEYLSSFPQSEKSDSRSTFLLLFHEIIHCLGYRADEANHWINKSTGKRYDPLPIYNYTSNLTTKNFVFQCTPLAIQVAKNRTGLSTWEGQDICLQLDEDETHLKGTIYALDVLSNPTNERSFITDASLAVIEDMGWYTVDFSYSECSTWSKSVLGNLYFDELNNPPINFPSKLKFTELDTMYPSFDFRGYLNSTNYGANRINFTRDQNIDHYYYENTTVIGKYKHYDYSPLLIPEYSCSPDWAIVTTYNNLTTTVECLPLYYNETDVFLSSYLDKTNVSCTETYNFGEGNVSCPPLNLIYKVVECESQRGTNYTHIPLFSDSKKHSWTLLILGVCFAAFLILVFAAGAIWKYYNFVHNQPDTHDEFKKMNSMDGILRGVDSSQIDHQGLQSDDDLEAVINPGP